jgi:threonine dehydratase
MPLKGKKVVAVISGGNVDMNFISRIIERGMVEAGRFATFTITLKDKPGELQKVLSSLTDLEANIQTVNLHRMGKHIYPGYAQLEISVETKNHDHIDQLLKLLAEKNYNVELGYY